MEIDLVRKIGVVVGVIGIIFGLGLLAKPDLIQRISGVSGTWISLRKATKALDKPVDIDPWVIRNGRVIGILMLLASLYVMIRVLSI